MSLDHLFSRESRPGYQCYEFAREAWKNITGEDIADAIDSIRNLRGSKLTTFRRLRTPKDPCLCIFRGVGDATHCGVFHQGRVLNLSGIGVQWMDLEVVMAGFHTVKFYASDNS